MTPVKHNGGSQQRVDRTAECPHRYMIRRNDVRRDALCKLRKGFMLKHWKCVGLGKPGCPIEGGITGRGSR